MDQDTIMAMTLGNACTGWLGGFVLLAVGLFLLGKVHKPAGWLMAGAGAIKLLANCCMVLPGIMFQADLFDAAQMLGSVPNILAGLMRFLVFGMLIGAFALAAKELARRGGTVIS